MSEKTHADIIAEMRYKAGVICPWQVNGGTCELCPLGHSPHGKDLGKYCSFHKLAHELDAAHKREVDALKQRCAELDAEVAAKDEVIKRLNDAISEEQRRKMATTENLSAVGNLAKLREVAEFVAHIDDNGYTSHDVQCAIDKARAAVAAPPRNCDVGTAEEQYGRMFGECYEWMCMDCKQSDKDFRKCALSWAQKPYKKGGAKC